MKTLMLFSMACLATAGLVHAQNLKTTEVPMAVRTSFTNYFPDVKEVKWSKENANEFEAEFESGDMEMSANFSLGGDWLGTETEIKKADLPKPVQDAIAKDFAGYTIEESETAVAPGKPIGYEVELAKGKVIYEVQFSDTGHVLKKEEKTKHAGQEKRD